MARAGCRTTNGLQKIEGDDVEKSLELLDKVLSEFEDPDSLPHIEPESPSQGNQSEDDGYMSMNGRRAKIPPDFHQPSDDSSASPPVMAPLPVLPVEAEPEETKSPPPPPEVAEAIISNLLPRVSPTTSTATAITTTSEGLHDDDEDLNRLNRYRKIQSLQADRVKVFSSSYVPNYVFKNVNGTDSHQDGDKILGLNTSGSGNGLLKEGGEIIGQTAPAQTTLPKTRPSTVIPSRYSSLPCSGPPRSFGSFDGMKGMAGGSFDGGRNALGMGISAVHDAVLRGGVARLPEPIVNEHPVTIYPGRASPPKGRVPPRTLPGSIERHREVCRNINSTDSQDSENSDGQMMSPLHRLAIAKSPSSPMVIMQKSHHPNNISPSYSSNHLVDNKNLLNNLHIPPRKRNGNATGSGSGKHHGDGRKESSDSEEFSDDSLEGQSLPPPPPPPVVPPPPSLSAPVTPSKRGSIAWEINLDDHLPPPPPTNSASSSTSVTTNAQNHASSTGSKKSKEKSAKCENSSSSSAKVIVRRRGRSVSGSQSSLASTPGNSGGSLSNNHSPQHHNLRHRSGSMEWPEPPDPPACTTEDEAASLYSDSDDVIPTYPTNLTGHGTYVIRKGRRERQRLSDINTSMSSSINSRLSSEGNLVGSTQNNSLFTPSSRHSIDLGSSTHSSQMATAIQNSILSPRTRLSLDLSSPNSTSELPQNATSTSALAATSNGLITANLAQQQQVISPRCYADFNTYSTGYEANLEALESNGNGSGSGGRRHLHHSQLQQQQQISLHGSNNSLNNNNNCSSNTNGNISGNGSLTRVGSLPVVPQTVQNDVLSTPRRELAPPIEEDEEQDSESQRGAPLREIENNISALLRGDIAVARVGDIPHHRRPLGFRPGVHKSESAKEMLLSQTTAFGPLPPSPPTSSPEPESDGFPPLPPSPQENAADDEDDLEDDVLRGMHGIRINSRTRLASGEHPPAVPPHRGQQPSINTLKTRSMDAGYTKKYASASAAHGGGPGTLPGEMPVASSRRRLMSGAFPKRSAQSPREERRLQTSCSLPETPIFARGCDIPRTPHRRAPDVPGSGGSRTAPRNTNTTTSLNSSIVGIGSTLGGGGRQRSISQALASGEMLRLAGGPARGWYPKQRSNLRPASTEHLDRLHRSQGSMRAWDSGTGGSRKPLTLPPNLTPKFFNKSPREALRRVTSLLIRKGNNKEKEAKREKEAFAVSAVHRSPGSAGDIPIGQTANGTNHHQPKKKGFFKGFWKKSKHYSIDQ